MQVTQLYKHWLQGDLTETEFNRIFKAMVLAKETNALIALTNRDDFPSSLLETLQNSDDPFLYSMWLQKRTTLSDMQESVLEKDDLFLEEALAFTKNINFEVLKALWSKGDSSLRHAVLRVASFEDEIPAYWATWFLKERSALLTADLVCYNPKTAYKLALMSEDLHFLEEAFRKIKPPPSRSGPRAQTPEWEKKDKEVLAILYKKFADKEVLKTYGEKEYQAAAGIFFLIEGASSQGEPEDIALASELYDNLEKSHYKETLGQYLRANGVPIARNFEKTLENFSEDVLKTEFFQEALTKSYGDPLWDQVAAHRKLKPQEAFCLVKGTAFQKETQINWILKDRSNSWKIGFLDAAWTAIDKQTDVNQSVWKKVFLTLPPVSQEKLTVRLAKNYARNLNVLSEMHLLNHKALGAVKVKSINLLNVKPQAEYLKMLRLYLKDQEEAWEIFERLFENFEGTLRELLEATLALAP